MTDRKPLSEALKSVVITASVDPKNWNVGLQAEASIRAVLAELDRQGYAVVPKVPPLSMCEGGAMTTLTEGWDENERMALAYDIWVDMVAAAPKLGGG